MILLKKFWWLILIVLAILVLAVSKLLKKKGKKKETEDTRKQGSEVLDRLGNVHEADYSKYMKIALDLTHHLGTAYAWYDPRRWTENDRDTFDLINPLSNKQLLVVADLYKAYSDGRDLYRDLSKMLDKKYYDKLNNL